MQKKNKKSAFANWFFLMAFFLIALAYITYFYRLTIENQAFLENINIKKNNELEIINKDDLAKVENDYTTKVTIKNKKTLDLSYKITIFLDGEKKTIEPNEIEIIYGTKLNNTLFENSIFTITTKITTPKKIKTGISIDGYFTEKEIFYYTYENEIKTAINGDLTDSEITLNQDEITQITNNDETYYSYLDDTLRIEFFETKTTIINTTITLNYRSNTTTTLYYCTEQTTCTNEETLERSENNTQKTINYPEIIENNTPHIKIENKDSEQLFQLNSIQIQYDKITN